MSMTKGFWELLLHDRARLLSWERSLKCSLEELLKLLMTKKSYLVPMQIPEMSHRGVQ